mgnify:CR=1 FL=1
MGLKFFFAASSLRSSSVKIRPKWDWNSSFSSFSIQYSTVKIRPKWDWNSESRFMLRLSSMLKSDQNGIEIKTLHTQTPNRRRLKSDQNGIEIEYVVCPGLRVQGLKSDQNGIEILNNFIVFFKCDELKSDQNGIEISVSHQDPRKKSVKIRPKWDWNK